jgi:hypothetical protein
MRIIPPSWESRIFSSRKKKKKKKKHRRLAVNLWWYGRVGHNQISKTPSRHANTTQPHQKARTLVKTAAVAVAVVVQIQETYTVCFLSQLKEYMYVSSTTYHPHFTALDLKKSIRLCRQKGARYCWSIYYYWDGLNGDMLLMLLLLYGWVLPVSTYIKFLNRQELLRNLRSGVAVLIGKIWEALRRGLLLSSWSVDLLKVSFFFCSFNCLITVWFLYWNSQLWFLNCMRYSLMLILRLHYRTFSWVLLIFSIFVVILTLLVQIMKPCSLFLWFFFLIQLSWNLKCCRH